MSKRLASFLLVIMLSLTGCIGVAPHGEARISGHGDVNWGLSISYPFFYFPWYFGYYGGHNHHYHPPYVYRYHIADRHLRC